MIQTGHKQPAAGFLLWKGCESFGGIFVFTSVSQAGFRQVSVAKFFERNHLPTMSSKPAPKPTKEQLAEQRKLAEAAAEAEAKGESFAE